MSERSPPGGKGYARSEWRVEMHGFSTERRFPTYATAEAFARKLLHEEQRRGDAAPVVGIVRTIRLAEVLR